MAKHDCPHCSCDDKVLVLPFDFLPPSLSLMGTSEGTWVVDERNNISDVWTKVWNDVTKGYDRIEFRSME